MAHLFSPLLYRVAVVSLLLLPFYGCSPPRPSLHLPAGLTLTPLAPVAADAPFACNPVDGTVAVGSRGLQLLHESGKHESIAEEDPPPSHLAWSSDGKRLAVAIAGPEESRLQLYTADGRPGGTATVRGRVTGLGWRGTGEVIALNVELRTYSFGGSLQMNILQWDGAAPPTVTPLFGGTLMRAAVARYGPLLPELLQLAVSPSGDAVVYTRFRDPPNVTAYLQVMLRHLETEIEWEIGQAPLSGAPPVFTPDGEEVIVHDRDGFVRRYNPWSGRETVRLSSIGETITVSATGDLLVDGVLYRSDTGTPVVPPSVAACFSHGGSDLIIRQDGRLSRITGLNATKAGVLLPGRIGKLRSWRSQGLITAEEYHDSYQRSMKR